MDSSGRAARDRTVAAPRRTSVEHHRMNGYEERPARDRSSRRGAGFDRAPQGNSASVVRDETGPRLTCATGRVLSSPPAGARLDHVRAARRRRAAASAVGATKAAGFAIPARSAAPPHDRGVGRCLPKRKPALSWTDDGGRARRRSGDLPLFRRTLCRLSYSTVLVDRVVGVEATRHPPARAVDTWSGPDGT